MLKVICSLHSVLAVQNQHEKAQDYQESSYYVVADASVAYGKSCYKKIKQGPSSDRQEKFKFWLYDMQFPDWGKNKKAEHDVIEKKDIAAKLQWENSYYSKEDQDAAD